MAPNQKNNWRNSGEGGLNSSTKDLEPTSQAPKILTNNRGSYLSSLFMLKPYKVMTFTYPTKLVELLKDKPIKLLINTKATVGRKFPELWKVKTNNKLHAKIAIGKHGVFLGSWNFSNFELHEACHIITDKTHIKELEEFFDKMWEEI